MLAGSVGSTSNSTSSSFPRTTVASSTQGLRLAIIQYDNRYCASASSGGRTANAVVTNSDDSRPFRKTNRICGVRVDANASIDAFWWMSAAINAAWARMHSHDHLLYCMTECNHPGTRERRSPQWCKLIALMDALQQPYDSVLYLDSDAFWKDPALNIRRGMLRPFAPAWFDSLLATPTMPEVVAFFGCNSPWDACGVQWNFSAAYGDRGSANSGVVLLRNQPKTRELLHQWWHSRNGFARPHHVRTARSCSDQAVLWRLWSVRPDLAASMRVLAAPGHSGSSRCMHVASNKNAQKKSPILHLSSAFPSYRYRTFSSSWKESSAAHDDAWCVKRVDLNATEAAVRLFGYVTGDNKGAWFVNKVDWDRSRPEGQS